LQTRDQGKPQKKKKKQKTEDSEAFDSDADDGEVLLGEKNKSLKAATITGGAHRKSSDSDSSDLSGMSESSDDQPLKTKKDERQVRFLRYCDFFFHIYRGVNSFTLS